MSLFDQLVTQALRGREVLAPLRPVVEKELLHHDILREMADHGFLRDLTLIGGTCLRSVYGSPRLSEDLDFTGAMDASAVPERLANLGPLLKDAIEKKYELPVTVSDPHRTEGLVRTWKIRIMTRPGRPDLPAQRIHVDVQALPAHDARMTVLRNPYRVEMGTSGLFLSASSETEILTDKLIALGLRENRIKNRDLWDIQWLTQRDVRPSRELLERKLSDRGVDPDHARHLIRTRIATLDDGHADFVREITRFLPPGELTDAIGHPEYWEYLVRTVGTLFDMV